MLQLHSEVLLWPHGECGVRSCPSLLRVLLQIPPIPSLGLAAAWLARRAHSSQAAACMAQRVCLGVSPRHPCIALVPVLAGWLPRDDPPGCKSRSRGGPCTVRSPANSETVPLSLLELLLQDLHSMLRCFCPGAVSSQCCPGLCAHVGCPHSPGK